MFGREKDADQDIQGILGEPRPYGVRLMALSREERRRIAKHRFEELGKLLEASGCTITPSPRDYAVNFHTGEHHMVVMIDPDDPRRISLMMVFSRNDGDIVKARWACFEATGKQFATKATVDQHGSGYMVTLSVGVYAEALHAFGDSLKAYVDDVIKLYNDFVELMVLDM